MNEIEKIDMNFTMYTGFSQMLHEKGGEKTAEYAAGMGFSSVEMFADARYVEDNPIPDTAKAKIVRDVLAQRGLSVACYSVFANVWEQKEHIDAMLRMVDIASELGAPFFHHTMLPWTTLRTVAPEYHEAIKVAVEAAACVADYADRLGITCIYEDQGCYINGVEGFRGFWSEMKKRCKNVGICGDLGNIMFVNEKPENFLEAYVDDICHVHIKDYLRKEAEMSPGRYWLQAEDNNWLRDTMVGSGEVDFEACMKILKNAGYKGAFALELGHLEPFDEGVRQAMEYLKRFW